MSGDLWALRGVESMFAAKARGRHMHPRCWVELCSYYVRLYNRAMIYPFRVPPR